LMKTSQVWVSDRYLKPQVCCETPFLYLLIEELTEDELCSSKVNASPA
jgi:hypothetical protein